MSSTQDTQVCLYCGEEVWYDFEYRTGKTTAMTACACQRRLVDRTEALEKINVLVKNAWGEDGDEVLEGDKAKDIVLEILVLCEEVFGDEDETHTDPDS